MNFVNEPLKDRTLKTFNTRYAKFLLERYTTMIHPVKQSVTCTCNQTLLADDLFVSFTYVQGYVAKCYKNIFKATDVHSSE